MVRNENPKPLSEYENAMTSIKALLKRRKLTYRDLAAHLNLSESGMKKILGAKDGSFQRVAEICKALEVSIPEMLSGQSETVRDVSFTEAQQEFLLKNPRALALYWLLVYERRAMDEALKLAGIGEKEKFPVLRKLDQLQLLDLLPGEKVRVPSVQQIRWVGGGPLVEKIYREWSQRFMRDVAKPEAELGPDALFLIRYFRVTPKTFHDLISALRDLEAEFVRRATREMRSEAPDLMHVRWVAGVDDKSFLDHSV